ncbi:2og-fe oxygenase [Moniliophthora roreri MCA 2997]|uniref:2og-fe oxygenase n=1 Tax=Moniliophthora roreri (strain MCA 2997) TaxID=1381753 RepID=V2WWE8_MONRO|nr:2og-fe oxygenase [Moniliophthora roreri MCA 2997]
MPTLELPPFPTDVPTHPLLIIDYALLKAGDETEISRLWSAATSLGFWYLKNHGADEEVNEMFEMGHETMALPLEEKMKFEQGDTGVSFGYKAAGANAVDASGVKDTVEFINIAKDDGFSWPKIARRAYPSTVNHRMDSTVVPFIKKSEEVNQTILEIFNTKLGLPTCELGKRHTKDEFSGSEARVIKNPVNLPRDSIGIGAHTDFGSLSFLHNRLGGLQVLPPGVDEWQYVKPIPGHAICNVGDALAVLSGGILHSNIHRVMPPPGAQSKFDRWSLVYFTRPGASVVLRPLSELSETIASAVNDQVDKADLHTGVTADEWFTRRIKNQRMNNRKGPETWEASRGTERGRA